LLVAGLSIPTQALLVKPAHATACAAGVESENTVYEDQSLYRSKSAQVLDVYQPGPFYHWVDTDLKAYHLSYNNHCYRTYYVSDWTEDGTPGNMLPAIRAWVCGRGPYYFHRDLTFINDWFAVGGDGASFGLAESIINWNLTLWNGVVVSAQFAVYDGCGPQADNYQSNAWTSTWYNPQQVISDPGNPYWYLHGW